MLKKYKKNFSRRTAVVHKYGKKKYSNPFFRKKKASSTPLINIEIPKKIKIFFIILFLLVLALVYFLLYSDYFMIKTIESRGGERIDSNSIETLAWQQIKDSRFIFWPQKNIFIFNESELRDNLNIRFALNELLISKKLPDKIIITLNEKEHSLIWLEKGIYYYTDELGYIIERIGDNNEKKDYPLIENLSESFIAQDRITIDPELLSSALFLNSKLKKINDFELEKFILNSEEKLLKAKLKDGPELYFDISKDLQGQLDKILNIKNEFLHDNFFNINYIDARIGDNVYYK